MWLPVSVYSLAGWRCRAPAKLPGVKGQGGLGTGQGLQLLQGIKVGADLGEDSVHCTFGIDLAHNAMLATEGNDRFCGIVISLQLLPDGLLIMVHTATLLSLSELLGHGLVASVHIQ